MSKNKTYSVLIISLLVINTLLVGFVVLKPKRPLGKENKKPKRKLSSKSCNLMKLKLFSTLLW